MAYASVISALAFVVLFAIGPGKLRFNCRKMYLGL